jgi:ribose transport system ATP-binding protein
MNTANTGASATVILDAQGLRKRFGDTQAVRGVDLVLREGEFVGLMGPNGAGKSTLIKMLSGVFEPDSGVISLSGRPVKSLAGRPEIGFVHQDLGLVDSMSVMDNLRLGAPPLRLMGPLLHRGREFAASQSALDRVELDVSLTAEVGSLSPGEKAMLAVARLLNRGARLVVVDETTSTLPPKESKWFIEILKSATRSGTAVLMVSHKLSEILSVAERVVMLIDGVVVADRPVTPDDRPEMVRLLAHHEELVAAEEEPPSARNEVGAPVLEMRAVCRGATGPVSFDVCSGEVVGLTGLVGSGLHTIGLLAAGAIKPSSGSVRVVDGAQTALIAPQRETQGCIAELPVLWNATLSALPKWRNPFRLLNLSSERADADAVMRQLRVTPANSTLAIGALSGGNQQKVLFARTLLRGASLFVLCEPTRGVDVATRREIYRLIAELRDGGAAILVVTSDSEDLFAICDRVGALTATGLSELWDADALTEESLSAVL